MSQQNPTYTQQDLEQLWDKLCELGKSYNLAAVGPTATKHGELITALNLIIYRLFNDGDSMFVGYGCEVCGPSAAFLMHERKEFAEPIQTGLKNLFTAEDTGYQNLLATLAAKLIIILETEQDSPLEKCINDYSSEWDNQKCNSCTCYHPIDEMESDGMGGNYCCYCGVPHDDEDDE